jgi:hypothetical protein
MHLRHRQCRRDAVAGRVAEHDEHAVAHQREVEGVAAGQHCGPEAAVHVVAGDGRHRLGQRAPLHDLRHLHLAAHPLAFDQRGDHLHALQGDGALRGERRRHLLVGALERAVDAIEHLHDAHQDAGVVDQRQGQAAARSIAGLPVDLLVEARIGVAVWGR